MIRRQRGSAWGGIILALVAGLGAFAPLACGGDNKGAETPANASASEAAPAQTTGSNTTNEQGQVVGQAPTPQEVAGLSGDAKASYDNGYKAFFSGDLVAAKQAFADAASKAPGTPAPHFSLGTVLDRLGDPQGAQAEYEKAFNADKDSAKSMGAYALSLAAAGKATQAESFLSFQHQKSPNLVGLTIYLAELKSMNGDSPSAQQLAQEALKKEPDNVDAMLVIARDYFRQRKYEIALFALGAILEGSPDLAARDKENSDALFLRGLIKRELGERKGALVDLEAALAKRADLVEALIGVGEMRLEAGNGAKALEPLERAVRYAPGLALAHLDVGDCYRVLSRPGDAKREFETALQKDTSLAVVHYDLGLLYLYSPTVPGMGSQDDQVSAAIKELELFKTMRGNRPSRGQGDDVDEVLNTAKRKQAELRVRNQPAASDSATGSAPPPPPPSPSGSHSGH